MIVEKVKEAYRFLGVSKDSSLSDITKAYRKLAKKYHPDSNPQDTAHSNTMMMKINDAYKTVKEFLEKGYSLLDSVQQTGAERRREEFEQRWWEQYQRRRAERARQEAQRAAREQEVIYRFWETLVNEQKRELSDKKSYSIIIKFCNRIISFFYEKNLHNPISRTRPYNRAVLREYFDMYSILFEKSAKLAHQARSDRYRRKSLLVHNFLKSFKGQALREFPIGFEKRASAACSFEDAVQSSDRFLQYYFSREEVEREYALRRFKESLNSFEYFIRNYPQSPLIEYAKGRIDLLERMYRAFMKER